MAEQQNDSGGYEHADIDLEPILQVRQMHLDYMARADQKASFLIGCYGVIFALFIMLVLKTSPSVTHPAYYLLGAVNFTAILVGMGALTSTIVPRMKGTHEKEWWAWFVRTVEGQERKTPTYFLGILDYSRDEFVNVEAKRFCQDKAYALERFAGQVYVLAGLCKTKFVGVGVGAHLLYVVVLLTVLMALIQW